MRFEIRKGGAFLILVALIGLSGAVFALGLVAGYQMARQNQPDLNQTSTTYPLPNAPVEESNEAPEAEMSPPAPEPPAPLASPAPVASAAPMKPAPPTVAAAAPMKPAPVAAVPPQPAQHPSPASHPSPATVARVRPPTPPPASDDEDDSEAAPRPAVAAPSSSRHRYNIQIEAVMDKSGADEMVSRLKALGYNAQEMTTTLSGQTWYRVRVGPYASSSEAAEAQERLRQQYRAAYSTSHSSSE
jgi:cell division septation protein DedD